MPDYDRNSNRPAAPKRIFYGWIIVVASTLILTMNSGVAYSYGVFFKPLMADFNWNRATTSGVQSVFLLIAHGLAFFSGWLADKYGVTKTLVILNFLAGLGLILTSRVDTLWQLFLSYSILTAIGFSANISVATATTARWFYKRRGLALGIVAAGVGLGTLFIVPLNERLIARFGWSSTFVINGIAVWVIMLTAALLLRRDPPQLGLRPYGLTVDPDIKLKATTHKSNETAGLTVRQAIRTRPMLMLLSSFFIVAFILQTTMVHLVNFATDQGITPAVAATFVSTIGLAGLIGRPLMGTASDKIGSRNALLICGVTLTISLSILLFARELWLFYLFAVFFGFGYGGEVPQLPQLVMQFFGSKSAVALVGAILGGGAAGGALGAWLAGLIFDKTQSYQVAFLLALAISLCGIVIILWLRKVRSFPTDH